MPPYSREVGKGSEGTLRHKQSTDTVVMCKKLPNFEIPIFFLWSNRWCPRGDSDTGKSHSTYFKFANR